MRHLVRLLGQGLVMHRPRGLGVEAQVELILPAELEPRPAQRVVADPRRRVALGEIGGVGRDLVGDHPHLHVVPVRQPQMLLRRHVAEHRRAEPADHRRADAAGDMIVSRRDVGGERPQRIERRLAADRQLLVHVRLDLVHRHMARPLDHHLAVLGPGDLRQLAQRLQFGELRLVVGIGDGARTQPVAQAERHVISPCDIADFIEMFVEEALAVVMQAPLGHDRPAA